MLMNQEDFVDHQMNNKRKSEKESMLVYLCPSVFRVWNAAYDLVCYAVFCKPFLYTSDTLYAGHVCPLELHHIKVITCMACAHPRSCDQATGMYMYAHVVIMCILCAFSAIIHVGCVCYVYR
jgi:hypothetical protein